jgi:hypothetical protein
MKEKQNTIIFASILGLIALWLVYANVTGWRIYNSDKVVKDNERTSSVRTRIGSGFHHK